MEKLYKFRALEDETLSKIMPIIENGEFWCSKLWDLNDPMEGVYRNSSFGTEKIRKMFADKDSYLICSFCGSNGFKNPLLWGYYANGFKGVVIEIEAELGQNLKKMRYFSPEEFEQNTNQVEDVITRKLNNWENEDEIRFFKKFKNPSNNNLQKIGKILTVYFGDPYAGLNNTDTIIRNSDTLRSYRENKEKLKVLCGQKNIPFKDIQVHDLINWPSQENLWVSEDSQG